MQKYKIKREPSFLKFLFIEFRDQNINLLFHLFCIHWLFLICALTGLNLYHSLGVLGQHSIQLSYLARANNPVFLIVREQKVSEGNKYIGY